MPVYEYTAITNEGKEVSGMTDAVDLGDAILNIRQKKLFPLKADRVYGMELTKEQKAEYMKRTARLHKLEQNPFLFLIARLRGKIRQRTYRKRQEKERQKLMVRKDEIISNAFAILDDHLRKASVGEVGGFHPPEDPLCSWFGDVLVCKEGEEWPSWKHPVSLKRVF